MIELTIRIIFSLLVVLGLMWALARVARRPLAGRAMGPISVLARQSLTRNASLALVRVGDQALVLGVTDQAVTLLAEADPSLAAVNGRSSERRESLPLESLHLTPLPVMTSGHDAPNGSLYGSILSPATWRQAAAVVRRGRRR